MICMSASIPTDLRADTIIAPEIMPQKEWIKEKKPFRLQNMQRQEKKNGNLVFNGIVIHNTDTLVRFWKFKTTQLKIQDYHEQHLNKKQAYRGELKGKPWGGFAYHYLIDIDGKIIEGRSTEYIGDSGTDYDMSGLILVVLEGKFEGGATLIERTQLARWSGTYTGEPREVKNNKAQVIIDVVPDIPTTAQKESLNSLATWLSKSHKIDPSTIKGHKEWAAKQTDCPGKNLMLYLPALRVHVIKALAQQ